MATFGHLATGLAAGRLPARASAHPRLTQVAFGLLALAPDLDDVIPGLRHDGPTGRTHTPAATLLASATAALAASRLRLPPARSFLAALIAIGSQPLLDTLTHGKGEAVGWPLSGKRYFKRVPGLPTWKPEKGGSGAGLRSLAGEAAWALPLFLIAALPIRRTRGRTSATKAVRHRRGHR